MKPRTGDFIIAAVVLILAVSIWAFPFFGGSGTLAIIEQDGVEVVRLSLSEERELQISGCTVRVEDGEIYVSESDCPDRVCKKTGRISRSGETIICVPNKISIKISGEGTFDVLAG